MGYNTSVIILNDALDAIENDKEFGKKIAQAIQNNRFPEDISSGCNANAASVIETHHADFSVLLACGGNCMSELGSVYNFRHNTEECQVQLLQMLADQLGYKITKK